MTSTLYYTVTRNEIRPFMPAVPVVVSAAGYTFKGTRGYYLRPPSLPPHVQVRGADCGGFVATMRWHGRYHFSPRRYVAWLTRWHPQWAATFDLCCIDASTSGDPGRREVRRRQHFTTQMAHSFWAEYQHIPLTWCPTIHGWYPEEYASHARTLAPLIHEMHETYLDTGSCDEEQGQQESMFRVGIGSLVHRPAIQVHEIIATVRAVLGLIPLHLWGTKLTFLRSPQHLLGEISLDTAAWNALFCEAHEARRQSGLSEACYSWQMSYPRYEQRVRSALSEEKLPSLFSLPQVFAQTPRERQVDASAPEEIRYRSSGLGSGEHLRTLEEW